MSYECPLPVALTSVVRDTCPFRFDQIVMLILFQRGGPTFATHDSLKLLATWTPFLAATDKTKVVVTPLFDGLVIPSSEALSQGGNDNTTFNGIPDYFGEGSVMPTGRLKNLTAPVLRNLDDLTQFSIPSSAGPSMLECMMVNREGFIFYRDGAAITDNYGFGTYNLRFASVGSEGFNSHNLTPFSWSFAPKWDRHMQVFKPAFDPLTQLVNP